MITLRPTIEFNRWGDTALTIWFYNDECTVEDSKVTRARGNDWKVAIVDIRAYILFGAASNSKDFIV